MLKDLHIKNLVLMESCSIELDKGLTILTGETGSGKTAILHSLKLILGQKLDISLIRRGEKKGSVQARFEISAKPLLDLLREAEIEVFDSTLVLYREISIEGKSKNFVNDRMVSLSFLQKIGSHLIQIVDQSSHHELRAHEKQRDLLDLFASLEDLVLSFSNFFNENKLQKIKLKEFEEKELQKQRELTFCLDQQKELTSVSLKEGEEEAIFEEYSLFSKSQEILEKLNELFSYLEEGSHSTLTTLNKSKNLVTGLLEDHPLFIESGKLIEESFLSLEEALHLLRKASALFEVNPLKLAKLEQKLTFIHRMKKKYGPTSHDWELYKQELEKKITDFDALEDNKKTLEEEILKTEKTLSLLGKEISEKRTLAANNLSLVLGQEMKSLNMLSTKVTIKVQPQVRSSTGEDLVSFWLEANVGEAPTSLKDHSSGGELSRLLLALKLSLAEKNNTPTLIFDEIDANVGGKSAKMIGEKLLSLSSHHQVICITHFPQVASFATTHLLVQKNHLENRTFSTIKSLDKSGKEIELLRMLGGSQLAALA